MKLKKILAIIFIAWLAIVITGGLALNFALPGKSKSSSYPENGEVRIAFFADPHIITADEGTETDIGGPGYDAPRDAVYSLNKCNPDYTFGLGDLTAHTTENEWIGYDSWENKIESPVFDILGNHDKEHLYGVGSCGTGYFTKVGRVSDTKVLKIGNNVFILVSEEHDPEGDGDFLMSTIPEKRFEFIEKQFQKYSENYNIFVMNHTPLPDTAAFSTTWFYGRNPRWQHISKKFKNLLYEYENSVDVHLSGHIHTDYRMRDDPLDQDLTEGVENVGKFVDGSKIIPSKRKYQPKSLPEVYFLNMPVVDIYHNWGAARFAFLGTLINKLDLNPATDKVSPSAQRQRIESGESGPPIMDILHTAKNSYFTGRGAIYYMEMEGGKEKVNLVTRWTGGNRDMENYTLKMSNPIQLGDGEMRIVDSDLSLRKKNDNLEIQVDNWFKIWKGTTGLGEFSKVFYQENKIITGLSIENYNLKDYSAEWKGSNNHGNTWKSTWHQKPENMGKINAVKIKIKFNAEKTKPAFIEDVNLQTKET